MEVVANLEDGVFKGRIVAILVVHAGHVVFEQELDGVDIFDNDLVDFLLQIRVLLLNNIVQFLELIQVVLG